MASPKYSQEKISLSSLRPKANRFLTPVKITSQTCSHSRNKSVAFPQLTGRRLSNIKTFELSPMRKRKVCIKIPSRVELTYSKESLSLKDSDVQQMNNTKDSLENVYY